jgi:hypothetical protein
LGPAIERVGAARRSRYLLRRTVRNCGSRWPVARIDESGRASPWAELVALHGGFRLVRNEGRCDWVERGGRDGVFPGLPFFLSDLRPQGFLGRIAARSAAGDLGVPDDPGRWSDDDVLSWLTTQGDDTPGDWVVGDASLELALRSSIEPPTGSVTVSDRVRRYSELADLVTRGEPWGSSAGGEQPKFATTIRQDDGSWRPVLVKFTPGIDTEVGRRWADLLVCESIASTVLASDGVPAAGTEIVDGSVRRFLEVARFDRVGLGGRRGVVSLAALVEGIVEEHVADWAAAGRALAEIGVISHYTATELRRRWCFGRLIANTDMHAWNTSFWWRDELPLPLAPVYDMLPMLFAPSAQGEVAAREFSPPPPLPALQAEWTAASRWAIEFWERVSIDDRVSPEFRSIASRARGSVTTLAGRFA